MRCALPLLLLLAAAAASAEEAVTCSDPVASCADPRVLEAGVKTKE
jgi:hypothetical protein